MTRRAYGEKVGGNRGESNIYEVSDFENDQTCNGAKK